MTGTLDLLLESNEPLQLMTELRRQAEALAGQHTDKHNEWQTVAAYARLAVDELKATGNG